jgi:hypothetical protein
MLPLLVLAVAVISCVLPLPYPFVNYSESVVSRVFRCKTLEIKALDPRRMELGFPRASFMMLEFAEMRKGRCHRVGLENLAGQKKLRSAVF